VTHFVVQSQRHVHVITVDGIAFGLLRPVATLYEVFIKLGAGLCRNHSRFRFLFLLGRIGWNRSIFTSFLFLLSFGFLLIYPFFWRFECEPKEILEGIYEGKGGVFFIVERLYLQAFPLEVDDPTHFVFLIYLGLCRYLHSALIASARYILNLIRTYFSGSTGISLLIPRNRPHRSVLLERYSSPGRVYAQQFGCVCLSAGVLVE
jgi:hypothetical protein